LKMMLVTTAIFCCVVADTQVGLKDNSAVHELIDPDLELQTMYPALQYFDDLDIDIPLQLREKKFRELYNRFHTRKLYNYLLSRKARKDLFGKRMSHNFTPKNKNFAFTDGGETGPKFGSEFLGKRNRLGDVEVEQVLNNPRSNPIEYFGKRARVSEFLGKRSQISPLLGRQKPSSETAQKLKDVVVEYDGSPQELMELVERMIVTSSPWKNNPIQDTHPKRAIFVKYDEKSPNVSEFLGKRYGPYHENSNGRISEFLGKRGSGLSKFNVGTKPRVSEFLGKKSVLPILQHMYVS